jgi:hypothetical protein
MCVLACTFGSCKRTSSLFSTPDAEVIRVQGRYAVVLPNGATLRSAFGSDWATQSLYYRCNRAVFTDGERGIVNSGTPMQPLAKGQPIFLVSGDDWTDLHVAVYSLERGTFIGFTIDFLKPSISVSAPTRPKYGTPSILPSGQLHFE